VRPIQVWRYYQAPAEWQVSRNGGDEDWLALVPFEYEDDCIGWVDEGHAFGCCTVDEFYVKDDGSIVEKRERDYDVRYSEEVRPAGYVDTRYAGYRIFIGCHA